MTADWCKRPRTLTLPPQAGERSLFPYAATSCLAPSPAGGGWDSYPNSQLPGFDTRFPLSFTHAAFDLRAMSERREPSLGDTVLEPEVHDPASIAPHRDGGGRNLRGQGGRLRWIIVTVLLAAIVALALALVHWRGAIGARLVAPAPQNRLVQQAAAALRAGHLTSPDGRGARELYEAAMARDPDDLAAREGLAKVANAALVRAQAAIDGDHAEQAQQDIDLARALSAPMAAVDRVDAALRKKTGGVARVAALLDRARDAADAGHIDDGDGSALAVVQQAVALAPDNAVVLERRRALLARMLGGVAGLLARGDIDAAQKIVDRVAEIDPGDLDLPDVRARLADATARRQREQDRQMDRADAELRAGRVEAATTVWQRIAQQSPGNARAHAGIHAAALAWVDEADRHAANFDFRQAQIALDNAHALAPDLPELRLAVAHVHQARLQHSGLTRNPRDKHHIDTLLAAVDAAIADDELVDPPGDSAYDKLHQAAAIAPADPRVLAAHRRFVAAVTTCIQRGMTDNRLARAGACFDALVAMQPTAPSLALLRTTLSHRWLDYADERIGAGELDVAGRAVDSARRLTPHDPAVEAMATRVRQARAGR